MVVRGEGREDVYTRQPPRMLLPFPKGENKRGRRRDRDRKLPRCIGNCYRVSACTSATTDTETALTFITLRPISNARSWPRAIVPPFPSWRFIPSPRPRREISDNVTTETRSISRDEYSIVASSSKSAWLDLQLGEGLGFPACFSRI